MSRAISTASGLPEAEHDRHLRRGSDCEHGRNHSRMVPLFDLRHCNRAGVRQAVLSRGRSR